jgi:hypothetical protein
MAKVFISYSRKDIGFVRKLAGDLEKAGYEVWWDLTDLRGGDDWLRVIPAAIESSDHFVVVLSPNSAISDWVKKEYTQALSSHKKIIPIMLERSSVPFALNTINYVDFTSDDYAANFKNLLDALGYSGENPVATSEAFPLLLRKYAIPILIGLGLLLALLARFVLVPLVTPTPTPTTTQTATDRPPIASETPSLAPSITSTVTPTEFPSATQTLTPTVALTPTLTATQPSLTPSPTKQPFRSIELCVKNIDARTINVREGPSSEIYRIMGTIPVESCLLFSAVHVNLKDETWLQVATGQPDPEIRQLAGGWVSAMLLDIDLTQPIPLPVVTLTPTPTPSDTPTITPTFTRTPSPIPTDTPVPTDTETPTATETPTP